jgi:cellulase/cellobiase CelA1
MRYRISTALGGTALVLATLLAGAAGATASPGSFTPTGGTAPRPAPTLTCPPAVPLNASVSAATSDSLTISYSIFLAPPCGYDPPITVTLFAGSEDARQWLHPVTAAVSGPERQGTVTIDGLTPGTAYWVRFSADGEHDPYLILAARTTPLRTCGATLTTDSAWGGGFVATVTVRNVGAETLGAWHVSWHWSGDQRIVSVWNGVVESGGPDVTIGNAPYNATLAPNGSTTFGILVAGDTPPGDITPVCAS